ncbi:GNAT family N-acetyltransferase [Krasilnikovia sp. MM14-A1259]|uniref:bifunctional acetate--CoA ligase family protein/GNAT family N-acetyltransferase n=1 Tax=Krasilnikovia sp. MM14-A1259 TaxID=3373539 RepID=UPI00380F12A2
MTSSTVPRHCVATVDALTADGGIVHLRSVDPDDAPELAALYRCSAAEGLRMRFFATPSDSTLDDEINRLCRPPTNEHQAIAAELAGHIVGVASYEPYDGRRAEFAIFIDDAQRGRGIGTLLLEHLADTARRCGITHLVGEVLPGNTAMLHVARDLTAGSRATLHDGLFDVAVPTGDDDAQQAIADRERHAERASLRPLLRPAAVAVIGAGRQAGGTGHETLCALREYGFTGRLYAVNPHTDTIGGVPAYPSLTALPGPVDLAVIAVPAPSVVPVLADAAAAGARAAVILSAGFGESDGLGRARQAELVRLARDHGIRLVGPNCLGVLNTDRDVRLNASFAPMVPPSGGLAVASQSGAVGIAVIEHAARTGCGLSAFVSLGNKADVSGNDLLAYWFDDPATTAVALYLESFGNPRKFGRLVRALSRRKPVLAVKSGRSIAGKRAGASHTAAAAVPDVTVDALFAQTGVVRAVTLGDLLDAARLLTDQPLPAGDRLAVVGNAGGLNILAADAAEAGHLRVPALSAGLRQLLTAVAPGAAGHDNPLDLGAGAAPRVFADAVSALSASGEADALLLVLVATRANDVTATLAALAPIVDAHPELTIAAVVIGSPDTPPTLGRRRVPVFDLPERAVRALRHAARYAAWRREPLGGWPALPDLDPDTARACVAEGLAAGGGWQPHERTARILTAYGIPLAPAEIAPDADAAVAAARRLGYPVALKCADPELVHKSDTGGVRLGLADADQVRAAFAGVTAAGRPGHGALVQPMLSDGVELSCGIVHDPLFGSLVMAGLGGVHTDLLNDRVFRLVPLTDLDAGRMWRELRGAPLLTGFRGSVPVDTAAVEDLLLRVSRLAEDLPEVSELDLNPVLAGPAGVVAVDAKLRLQLTTGEPDPILRDLRRP